MRKSFTRFLSLFVLFSIFSLFAVASIPTVTVNPATPATNVDPRGKSVTFTLTFDQDVFPGTGNAGVIALSSSADVQLDPIQISGMTSTNPVTQSTVVINGKVVTVTFKSSTPLPEETTFYITATSDALKNAAGEYWAGWRSFPGTHDYQFTTGDFTAPTAVAPFVPVDDSSANAISLIYSIQFSEFIQPGTGFIQTGDNVSKPGNIGLYGVDGNVIELFDINSFVTLAAPATTGTLLEGQVGIYNNAGTKKGYLYINPTDSKLKNLQKYYVRVLNTAIIDFSGNTTGIYEGINTNKIWNFQLADATAPVFSVDPVSSTLGVQQNKVMKMTFTDDRVAAGLPFVLQRVTGATSATPLTVGYNVTTMISFLEDVTGGTTFAATTNPWKATYTAANEITIEFTTTAKFKTGANYQIDVVADKFANVEYSNVLRIPANIPVLSAPSTFKAGDFTAPVPATGKVYAQSAGNGSISAPVQVAPFNLNTTAADKDFTKVYFGLETDDTTPPASGLGTLPTTVKYIVRPATATAPVATDVLTSGIILPRIGTNNNKHEAPFITKDESGNDLLSNKAYKIYYVITDAATVNNNSVLQTANVTTNDIEAPVPTAKVNTLTANNVVVANGATVANVKMDSPVTITFDENVLAAATNITVKYQNPATLAWASISNGGDYSFAFNGTNAITITGAHADILTYTSALWKSKGSYQVIIDNNEITDDLTGKTGTANPLSIKTYTFTVEDYEGPVITFNPAHNATGVSIDKVITLTFTEAPYNANALLNNTAGDPNFVGNFFDLSKAVTAGGAVSTSTHLNKSLYSVSINDKVVSVTANAPMSTEWKYGVYASTDLTDEFGYKLDNYKGNTVTIASTQEYAHFTTADVRIPLVQFDTWNGSYQGLVNVPIAVQPVVFIDESVNEIGAKPGITTGTLLSSADPNMMRTLITLRKGGSTGVAVDFNVSSIAYGAAYGTSTGTLVTLTPIDKTGVSVSLTSNTVYYIEVTGLRDAAGNVTSGTTTFNTKDLTALTASTTPKKDDVQVALSGNIEIVYNMNISKTSTTNGLYFAQLVPKAPLEIGAVTLSKDITDASITVISGNKVVIPYMGLLANQKYDIVLTPGAFTAANGATSPAIALTNSTFTTIDNRGPQVTLSTGLTPAPGSVNSISISGGKFKIVFGEEVQAGSGIITIKKPEAGAANTVAQINVATSLVNRDPADATNKTLLITIPVTLVYDTKYFVEIPVTAFTDKYSNNWQWETTAGSGFSVAPISAPPVVASPYSLLGGAVWDFSTELDAAPVYNLAGFNPVPGSNTISASTALTIAFSEPMSLNTIGVRKVTIYDPTLVGSSEHAVIDLATTTLTWSDDNKKVTFANPVALLANRDYAIGITPSAFISSSNQVIAGGLISSVNIGTDPLTGSNWYFTTRDITLPSATLTFDPTNSGASVAVGAKLLVTFNENVSLVTGTDWKTIFTPSGAAWTIASATKLGNVVTITPSSAFASLSTYGLTLDLNKVKDGANNQNSAQIFANFTAEDKTAPSLVINVNQSPYSLAPYSVNKAKVEFVVTDINSTKSDVWYFKTAKGAYTASTITTAIIEAANTKKNLTNGAGAQQIEITGLNEWTEYDIWMFAKDANGNSSSIVKAQVITLDVTKPTVLTANLYPANNGTSTVKFGKNPVVAAGLTFRLPLSEKIQSLPASTAKIIVRRYDNNEAIYTIAAVAGVGIDAIYSIVSSSTSASLDDVVSFSVPANKFDDLTKYYVEFDYGMLTDANNGTVGAANNLMEVAFIGKDNWSFTTADEIPPTVATAAGIYKFIPLDETAGNLFNIAIEASNQLSIEFTEEVQPGSGNIYIYRDGQATPHEVFNVNGSDVSFVNPKIVTINRHNVYASEVGYYILIDASAIKDKATVPNNFTGILATNTWNFSTKDVTAPVIEWNPINNTTGVMVNASISAKFIDLRQSEIASVLVPGTIIYEALYNNAALITVDNTSVNGFTATADGVNVTPFTAKYRTATKTVEFGFPGGSLVSNKKYIINYTPGTLKDDAGNSLASSVTAATSTVTFNTVDNSSPIITFSPTKDQVNVSLNSSVTIKFNKKIYNYNDGVAGVNHINLTPTAEELKLSQYVTFKDLTPIPTETVLYDVTVVDAGKEYLLTPKSPLKSSHQYEVVWVANANAGNLGYAGQSVYDKTFLNNNVLDVTPAYATSGGDKVKFTAEDTKAPTATLSPLNNLPTFVNRNVPLIMTFSESVKAGVGTIQIRRGNGQLFDEINVTDAVKAKFVTNTLTIKPGAVLEPFTRYYVIIPNGAITDVSSNANPFDGFSNDSFWSFKTDDGEPPVVKVLNGKGLYSPENGSNNNAVFSNLTLQFSENIQANATGNFVIYYKNFVDPDTGDGNAIEIIPITSPDVVISGSNISHDLVSDVVTIDPKTTFDKLGTYYIRIDQGIVKDLASTPAPNDYAGIPNNTTWYFTVTDNTKPALALVSSLSPANGATNVGSKPVLTMTFDRNVAAGAGSIKLFEYFYNTTTFLLEEKLVESMPVTPSMISGMVVTATPTVTLGDNKVYYVLVDNNAISNTAISKDLFPGITSPFAWRFTTGDNAAPTLTVTAPVAPVAKTFTVGLVFNEVVTGLNKPAFTDLITNGTLNDVTGSGANYALSITAAEGAVVGIIVPNTIADGSGNKFAGVTLTYTVGDFTGPIVTADPATGLNLKGSFPVVLNFSADAVVTAADITVTGATTKVITNVANVYTVAVTAADLATVVVTVAPTVKDNAGNLITGTLSFTYKVGDNTQPTLVIAGPTAPIETAFILSFTFNEDVTNFSNAVTVENGVIKQIVGSGKNYFVSIVAPEKAAVNVIVSDAVVDANSNKFAGKTMTFNVGDFTGPTVVVTPPSTPVASVFSVGLKFNEPVSGLLFGGSAVTVTGGTIVDITGSGDTYTLVVSALEMTDVKIVLNNTIQDVSANKFAGLTLNYTTGDLTAPQLVTWTPTIADVLTDNHPKFKMIFDENVKVGTGGNLVVYKLNATTPSLTIPILANMIVGKEVSVNYTTTSGLDKNTSYYVLVNATALTDNAGNAFAGVKDVAAWTFKTGANFATANKPEIGSLEFKVYPNPFVEFVNVANASQLSKVVVTNIAGQVVKEVVNPTDIIQLSELRSGIYFMSLYNKEDIIVKTAKIVKR